MLSAIVRTAIRSRGIVVALACVLLAWGIQTARVAQYDVFPEFAPPLAQVQALAPGFTAEQVELLVTQPIENALAGVPGVQTLRSQAIAGLSLTTLAFADGTDVDRARERVNERLANAGTALAAGVGRPRLLPLTSSTGVVLVAAVTSHSRSLAQLTDVAQWTIKPHLLGLPGVADVVVFGGERRELQIQVDPQRLLRHGLTLQDVISAARQSTAVRGAGLIEGSNQRLPIRTEGQARTPGQVAAVPVAVQAGIAVRLGDVAAVRHAGEAPVGAATLNGEPAVMLIVESQYGADPLETTRQLDAAFAALRPSLAAQDIALDTTVFRPAKSILTSLGHLRTSLLVGGALVVLVLFAFLANVRTAVISACAIPLSLLVAVVVLHRFGISLNTMSLGGLAIALGEVVDDAIIDVENIHRRLRQNRRATNPLPAHAVIWQASLEVRSAVVYATFIVTLALVPVLMMPGVAGHLFGAMGKAYVLAVLASLGVALTLTPALASWLLASGAAQHDETGIVTRLKSGYGGLLARIEQHPRAVVGAVAVACVIAASSLPFMTASFIPPLKEGHYTVHAALAPGTSLTEAVRVGNRISAALKEIPGVRLVAQRAGRASEVVDPTDVSVSEFEVDLHDSVDGAGQQAVLERIRRTLEGFAGVNASANTFLTERIDETITGQTAPVVVEVHGSDLDVIDAQARQVALLAQKLPGAIGVAMQAPPVTPQLTVRLRPPMLEQLAIRPGDALDTIQSAFHGTAVAQLVEGNRTTDVVVLLDPAHRRSAADLGSLRVLAADGHSVALSQIAEITQTAGRAKITHSMGQRLQTITMGVRGRSVSEFAADLQAHLGRLKLPSGVFIVVRGEAQERARAQEQLLLGSAVALAGIAVLLWLALRSRRALALVLANLPFALVGGVVAVLATGAELSLGSLVGFVTLFGITLRNSIMLISHYQHLVAAEGVPWDARAAVRGARERLVPILMTACVTALALLPLALRSGEAGNEVEGPMAIVIIGGLITSTVLNLLVLPTLALRFGRFDATSPDEDATF